MLSIGNRIKYNNTIYRIVGINFSTYYLRADNSTSSYDYDMQDVYRQYKDFEILRKMTIEDIIRVFSSKSEYDQAVSNLEKNDGDCKYILLSELEMIWNNLQ